ncbi:MAG TPA: hypothetical protein VGA50_12145 [Kiloniellales bacterium]
MIRRSLIGLVALAGATAACANSGVVLSPTSYYGAYTPSVLNYSATSGGILVEVVGNPFDAPQGDLERAITGAMTGAHFGPHVDFVTTAPEGFRSPYRIVLVFDPAQNYTAYKLCSETQSIEPGTGDTVKAHAALCADYKPLTGVTGSAGSVSGPGDRQFRQLISQITTNLLPPYNPDRRDGDRGIFL